MTAGLVPPPKARPIPTPAPLAPRHPANAPARTPFATPNAPSAPTAPVAAPESSSATPSATPRRARERFLRDVMRGAAVILLLHAFVLQVSVVRGHSMEPCLNDGDRLVVDRISPSLSGIARFDVVVMRCPTDPQLDYVKRIVGLPGERVAIRAGRVVVDGLPIADEPLVLRDDAEMDEIVVAPGHYFVLGDNRAISCDSREFGVVPAESVRGKVRARFWPLTRASLFH